MFRRAQIGEIALAALLALLALGCDSFTRQSSQDLLGSSTEVERARQFASIAWSNDWITAEQWARCLADFRAFDDAWERAAERLRLYVAEPTPAHRAEAHAAAAGLRGLAAEIAAMVSGFHAPTPLGSSPVINPNFMEHAPGDQEGI